MPWRLLSLATCRFFFPPPICLIIDIFRFVFIVVIKVPHENIKRALAKVGKTSYDSAIDMAVGGRYSRSDFLFNMHRLVGFHFFLSMVKFSFSVCLTSLRGTPWWWLCRRNSTMILLLVPRTTEFLSTEQGGEELVEREERTKWVLISSSSVHVFLTIFTRFASTSVALPLSISTEMSSCHIDIDIVHWSFLSKSISCLMPSIVQL